MPKHPNMRVWELVETTDPEHTKRINQRGGFHAIDAHYQVQRATQVFGPVGQGWGYRVKHEIALVGDHWLALADVELWWRDPDSDTTHTFGPVRGCNALLSGQGRLDDDAAKKAMTDALTKGLSHLGFSADVFLGKYDDNKYVQRLRRGGNGQSAPSKPAPPPAPPKNNGRLDDACASVEDALGADRVVRNVKGGGNCVACGEHVDRGQGFVVKQNETVDWKLYCARCTSLAANGE